MPLRICRAVSRRAPYSDFHSAPYSGVIGPFRDGTGPVAMNEIKFACPHCHQHIACDEGYCGYQIACPACEGAMIVPKLATFGLRAPANLSLALPVATPVPTERRYPVRGNVAMP